jgi:hypothetical protein
MPQWAGSSWYFLRYLDPMNDKEFVSREAERYWMPVDLYIGGAEHAVLHLLYARFWHKFLFDLGKVSHNEPFHKLVNQGLILGEDGEKMSKSRGNVVNPDDVIEQYGADSMRLYEMFMGPLERQKPWQTAGMEGQWRFLKRAWRVTVGDGVGDGEVGANNYLPLLDVTPPSGILTLHSPSVTHALERMVGVFEGGVQRQIILQLANVLQGIIAQKLLPSVDRNRRALAYELLLMNGAVRSIVRENQLHQLDNVIQMSRREGMVLMDNCLHDLYLRCQISYDVAIGNARHPDVVVRKRGAAEGD